MKALLGLLVLIGCSSTATTDFYADSNLSIVLPPRFEHWRSSFIHQWQQLTVAQKDALSRWEALPSAPLKVVMLADNQAAQQYYLANGLSGRADTPRTFISKRLAILVLPSNDRLLAELPVPPQTILHDFRHEASHLISCDYPELLSAPTWFQEGWAEMWAPLQGQDDSWPHVHDLHHWSEQLNWDNLSTAPSEVKYSFWADAVNTCLNISEKSQPWLVKPRVGFDKPSTFNGLRGRHAFWDIDNNHFLLASRIGSQVELDLPTSWSGNDDLVLSMRVGATSSPIAGIVFFAKGESIENVNLLRLPIDVNGGINAYVDTVQHMLVRSLYPLPIKQKFGEWRQVRLRRENGAIVVTSGEFERIIPIVENQLQFPMSMRIYARNGSLELKHEKILH
ncbi:MAG: hypothetical protein H8E25_10285 [Planctomycetes bacterium]|nr:hypothetical protein [Planctomycetota bacterium]